MFVSKTASEATIRIVTQLYATVDHLCDLAYIECTNKYDDEIKMLTAQADRLCEKFDITDDSYDYTDESGIEEEAEAARREYLTEMANIHCDYSDEVGLDYDCIYDS